MRQRRVFPVVSSSLKHPMVRSLARTVNSGCHHILMLCWPSAFHADIPAFSLSHSSPDKSSARACPGAALFIKCNCKGCISCQTCRQGMYSYGQGALSTQQLLCVSMRSAHSGSLLGEGDSAPSPPHLHSAALPSLARLFCRVVRALKC